MKLHGSCQCGKIKFSVESETYLPYQLCYCGICRKTQGGGGFSINIGADARTLKIKGEAYVTEYRARIKNPEDQRAHRSQARRTFCSVCGSGLWLWDPDWPELIHPYASAIDSDLPEPPKRTHIMLEFKPSWVKLRSERGDKTFKRYPEESLGDWHKKNSSAH
jgi:hypothetical protein